MQLICALILVYMVILVARAVMSWFPVRPGSPAMSIYSLLLDLTEPVLAPLRRVIPPAGMLDLSFIVLFIGLSVLQRALC